MNTESAAEQNNWAINHELLTYILFLGCIVTYSRITKYIYLFPSLALSSSFTATISLSHTFILKFLRESRKKSVDYSYLISFPPNVRMRCVCVPIIKRRKKKEEFTMEKKEIL